MSLQTRVMVTLMLTFNALVYRLVPGILSTDEKGVVVVSKSDAEEVLQKSVHLL